MGRACSMHGTEMHTTFWSENMKGRENLGKPRPRWKDNIRVDLRELGWGGVDWIHLAEDRG